ncbi:MAG TPA: phosphoribosyltransferase family protein [Polyangiaceae bacterium]|nr:phosphoribosyltransferase family protein [Polyangiaceae bacterium]
MAETITTPPLGWVLLRAGLARATAALADFISPPRCAACDDLLGRRAVFCADCASAVTVSPIALAGTVSWVEWGGPVKEAVVRMKYGRREDVARALASLVENRPPPQRSAADLVMPVPLHPKRLAERGFNQSTHFARAFARRSGVPLSTGRLSRRLDTAPQAGKTGSERRTSLDGAFVAQNVEGLRVAVVDDVVTTGSTLAACSDALRASGARAVELYAFARAI